MYVYDKCAVSGSIITLSDIPHHCAPSDDSFSPRMTPERRFLTRKTNTESDAKVFTDHAALGHLIVTYVGSMLLNRTFPQA